jgi:hypothetical protein
MKKSKLAMIAFICAWAFINFNNVYAASGTGATSIIPSLTAWKDLKICEFIKLSPKDIRTITGKKMNAAEKASFAIMKIKMKRAVKNNPDLTVGEYSASIKKQRRYG